MTRQIRLPRNINEVLSGRLQTRVSERDIPVPPGWDIYVTDSNKGYARSNSQTCTVPLWAYKHDDPKFVIWYLAHELAHAWAYVNGGNITKHGSAFYKEFKWLCPPQLWHYELEYKKTFARRARIDPNPLVNLRQGSPVTEPVSAGCWQPESITGGHYNRKPDVVAANDKAYNDYVNSNPLLQKALMKIPDRDRKSFIRGWAKHDKKVTK